MPRAIEPGEIPSDVLAVIVASVDAMWPRAVMIDPRVRQNDDDSPSWRFSGRYWGARVAADRARPTF